MRDIVRYAKGTASSLDTDDYSGPLFAVDHVAFLVGPDQTAWFIVDFDADRPNWHDAQNLRESDVHLWGANGIAHQSIIAHLAVASLLTVLSTPTISDRDKMYSVEMVRESFDWKSIWKSNGRTKSDFAHIDSTISPDGFWSETHDEDIPGELPCATCHKGYSHDIADYPMRKVTGTFVTKGADPTTAYNLECGHSTIDL